MRLSTGDRVELADLVARYALHVDRRDLAALAGLFTDDAVLVLPDPPERMGPVLVHRGWEEIARVMSSLEVFPVTMHALAGQVFDPGPEPGTATGSVACTACHLSERDGTVVNLAWHLRYADIYRRQGGAWRIARRELHLEWIETRPVRRWRGDSR
ncbi:MULTISPECIES: nuclear transport factor 2 family protein [Thermomonospora]|uniref:SnoaL-like domain-containing protein n=1 Tax=Thermomonospora curvata (strain ATCC 19995 / DSM 43183 / JCM 3096 / KCTC 9072 / NBRC 15933 / NCIMB 10081 / Henssen B9) TaxID=471852 RepID=D1ABM6_THECD|nr:MULTISPECIES: nuclear transport factor 2 family protein [Thermomonospora]ACY99049.1 conserved hypothetical protein [Thermomonospora curvata DSM 43183]PKK13234.1 MAG: nuclear transport factor 2 family protein [Thermomonospora sp. CIF 1]